MNEIGILGIHAYVPETVVDVIEHASDYGVDASFVRNKTGFVKLRRRHTGEDTADLAERVVRCALSSYPGLDDQLGLLLVVTQNPDGHGLPHASAIVHGRLGLPTSVAAFDIPLGCSGWVYALSIAKSFMEANHINFGLLVTADPYSKIVDPQDRNTSLLFGDAATATLLGRDPTWQIGRFIFGTDGRLSNDLRVDDGGRLAMNGRSIFTFSATMVPACVQEVLAANRLSLEDSDRIVLYQASRYIVEAIGERLGCPAKVPFLASEVGNTVSSSIPLALAAGCCADDRVIVVTGFGVGLSWAATVLWHRMR
jgi:3-oxoacyl-[acyl-carrier-protein] synthase-3